MSKPALPPRSKRGKCWIVFSLVADMLQITHFTTYVPYFPHILSEGRVCGFNIGGRIAYRDWQDIQLFNREKYKSSLGFLQIEMSPRAFANGLRPSS